jgi:hypothetical protein
MKNKQQEGGGAMIMSDKSMPSQREGNSQKKQSAHGKHDNGKNGSDKNKK